MQHYRAITSTGAVVDDPSVGQLADLVAEVDRSGRQGFLFLERRGAGPGQSYLQACRNSAAWVLELRDGGPSRQYRASVADAANVFAGLASWLFQTRGWQTLSWQQLGRRPEAVGLVG